MRVTITIECVGLLSLPNICKLFETEAVNTLTDYSLMSRKVRQ